MVPRTQTPARRGSPRRILAAAAFGMLVAAAGVASAAETGDRPIVVELFTSQGCSSCPPADRILADLAERPDLVALSLHVDYWDYIGWKDPFGSPLNTERQRRYAGVLGLHYVFTPQMVIDGVTSVVGSNRAAVDDAIEAAKNHPKPVQIAFTDKDGGRVVVSGSAAPPGGASVWLAVYDERQETAVKRGENAGRELSNANVVRRLERIGTWTGQRVEIPMDFAGAAARGRYACAVIVQAGEHGPVLGAAKMRLSDAAD